MKQKILKILKEPIIYIVLFCIIFQMGMYSKVEKYKLTPDSGTYINFDENIFKGEVDEERTPVYPYFIKIIKKMGGEENLARNVVIVQKILFIFTIILFYLSIKEITQKRLLQIIFTVVFGICPYIILWNITVLTEALSVFEMALLVFLTVKYINKKNNIIAIAIALLIFAMIMTRPIYIYLLPIYILFWVLRFFFNKEEIKSNIIGITSCLVCAVLLLTYCGLMKINHNSFSLTAISYVNNFITALDSKSYKYGDNKELVAVIDNLMETEGIQDTWKVLNRIKEEHPEFTDKDKEQFAKTALKNDPNYMKYLINKTATTARMNIGTTYIEISNNMCDKIGNILLPVNFGAVYIMMLISIIYLIYNIIKTKKINWIIAFFTVLILANIFTLIVGAPYEQQRLFLSSIESVLLLIIYTIDSAWKGGKENDKTIKKVIPRRNR